MKECKGKLIINELATRTLGEVAYNRDKKGRRGRVARESAAYVAHAGIPSPKKSTLQKRIQMADHAKQRFRHEAKPTSPVSESLSPSHDYLCLDESKPVFYVPSRLINIKWKEVQILHITTRAADEATAEEVLATKALPGRKHGQLVVLDKPTVLTIGDEGMTVGGKAGSPSKSTGSPEKSGGLLADARGDSDDDLDVDAPRRKKPAVPPKPVDGGSDSDSDDDDDDDDDANAAADGGDAVDVDGKKAAKILKKKAALFSAKVTPFDEYLHTDHTGDFAEKQLDLRKELRQIRENTLGRNLYGTAVKELAVPAGGVPQYDDVNPYDRVYDPTEATAYDLRDDSALRRDPYIQALNRELAPDLVEKFYDPKTNAVRVRRRFTVVEKPGRLNWKLAKVVVPWQAKYHFGKGGVDPALQPTYPLEAVMKHADENVHKRDEEGDAPHGDNREPIGPFFPSPVFSGFFRR